MKNLTIRQQKGQKRSKVKCLDISTNQKKVKFFIKESSFDENNSDCTGSVGIVIGFFTIIGTKML